MSTATNPTNPTTTANLAHCQVCGASAAPDQRYCLSCGQRREDVPDPVSRYLGEASAARARVAAAMERQTQARGTRRLPRLSTPLSTALVVVALLVGIEIGQSSSGGTSGPARPAATATTRSGSGGSGNSAVEKVAKSKGKSYVQQEQNLPTSVTP